MTGKEKFIEYVRKTIVTTQIEAAHLYELYYAADIINITIATGGWGVRHGAWLDATMLREVLDNNPVNEGVRT